MHKYKIELLPEAVFLKMAYKGPGGPPPPQRIRKPVSAGRPAAGAKSKGTRDVPVPAHDPRIAELVAAANTAAGGAGPGAGAGPGPGAGAGSGSSAGGGQGPSSGAAAAGGKFSTQAPKLVPTALEKLLLASGGAGTEGPQQQQPQPQELQQEQHGPKVVVPSVSSQCCLLDGRNVPLTEFAESCGAALAALPESYLPLLAVAVAAGTVAPPQPPACPPFLVLHFELPLLQYVPPTYLFLPPAGAPRSG